MGCEQKKLLRTRRKEQAGRGTVGTATGVGVKDRDGNKVPVAVMKRTNATPFLKFAQERIEQAMTFHTADWLASGS